MKNKIIQVPRKQLKEKAAKKKLINHHKKKRAKMNKKM